ncbi:hypothetical protein [uncultured Croceicoccus sp.]|uniref:hypothetical protein n=1 Tax=uncultured Croceicoccus sp. TaxID=1295329 RepID=UPI0026349E1E|nr:hypothetical protein [uncultured Croceicoccus sp.]
MIGEQLAHAAMQFLDAPFRIHGRDPATGLDCIGLLHASLSAVGRAPQLPVGYRLRNDDIECYLGYAEKCGLWPADGDTPGDVVLAWVHRMQPHVAIRGFGPDFIHAHAGLRRIVAGPIDPGWRIAHRWRLSR